MKRNLMPLLGVAFAAAIVATGIFYGLLIPRLHGGPEEGQRTAVTATRVLEKGTVLRAEDLAVVTADSKSLPPDTAGSIEQVVGVTLLEPASPNQPLTERMLARRGAVGGPSLAIPTGKRAVTIHPGDSSGVVAMLRPGSKVDIQVLESSTAPGGMRLHRILEDIEVLSVNPPDMVSRNRPVATLLVGPQDADRLSLADATMTVRVILRNPNDRALKGPESMTPTSILSQPTVAPASGQAQQSATPVKISMAAGPR
jgi:Flp pilus assembly protein CpaB